MTGLASHSDDAPRNAVRQERPWRRLAGGFRFLAAPDLADAEEAARSMIEILPELRPGPAEAAVRARLEGKGRLLRWRRYRAAILLDDSPVGPAHVKVYHPKDALEVLIELATPSRGGTSWKMGRALLAAGIPTPEPRLLLVRKPFRRHRESVLVTRPLRDAVMLNAELKSRLAAKRPLRPLLDEVARLAADLHGAGFFHGDFTARNLVLAGPEDDRRLSVIDLDRSKDLRRLPPFARRRIQALDLRLLLLTTWGEVSRREWLRLLAVYARRSGFPKTVRRSFARRVLSAKRGRVRVGARAPVLGGRAPWPD